MPSNAARRSVPPSLTLPEDEEEEEPPDGVDPLVHAPTRTVTATAATMMERLDIGPP